MNRIISKYSFLTIFLLSGVFIFSIFILLEIPEKQGFNPSDEGVVLAQSYRILNGEIPHKDFISIRPVFSGIIHIVHFFSPLPLVISGRWFSLFEMFLISFFWLAFTLKLLELKIDKFRKTILPAMAIVFVFSLNLNSSAFFPRTTTDALLFGILSLFLYKTLQYPYNNVLSLLTISIAALCRQSFVLPQIVFFAFQAYQLIRKRPKYHVLLIILIGALPEIIYLSFLMYHNILNEFINQMTGRSELLETGVLRYIKEVLKSPFIMSISIIGLYLFISQKRKNKLVSDKHLSIFIQSLLYISPFVLLIIAFLFLGGSEYHPLNYPFYLFYFLVFILFLKYLKKEINEKEVFLVLCGLFLAWTCSVSLGVNSPILASGVMGVTIFFLVIPYFNRIYNKYKSLSIFLISILVLALFSLMISQQEKYNYRDLEFEKANLELGAIHENFEGIHTNKNTYSYIEEFFFLYDSLNLKDRFTMIPYSAIIYPVIDSRNPFPLDWVTRNEYIGAENQFNKLVDTILNEKDIFILIDKYSVPDLAYSLENKVYDLPDLHSYLPDIIQHCELVETNSKYFFVYSNFN